MQIYKTKYQLRAEAGDFTREEITTDENNGGCDAFILTSLIYPPDGRLSMQLLSFDGRNGGTALDVDDMFMAWMVMGRKLAEHPELEERYRLLAKLLAESVFPDN